MALREILVHFGFDVDHTKLVKAETGVNHLVETVGKLGAGLAAAFVGQEIKEFFEKTIEGAQDLSRTADMFGVAADELQRLRYAANMADVSAEVLDQGIRFLSRNMGQAKDGSAEMSAAFKDVGIDLLDVNHVMRPVTEVLSDLSDKVQALPPGAERMALATKLMGRGGAQMIPMLNKGSAAIKQWASEVEGLGGGYTKGFLEKSEEVEQAQKRLTFQWSSARTALVTALIPAAMSLMSAFSKVLSTFTDLNKHVDIGRTLLVGLFGLALSRIPAITGAVTLATAKFALLWLVADDLYTLFSGGDSEVGAILDSIFGEGAAESFVASMKYMFGSWEGFTDTLKTGFFVFGAMTVAVFQGVGQDFRLMLAQLADAWDRFVNALHLPKGLTDFLGNSANKSGREHEDKAQEKTYKENIVIAEDIERVGGAYTARRDADAEKYNPTYGATDDQGADDRAADASKVIAYEKAKTEGKGTTYEKAKTEGKGTTPVRRGVTVDWSGNTMPIDMIASAPQNQRVATSTNVTNHTVTNHVQAPVHIEVRTLPATTTTQAREVGRATERATKQASSQRQALNATEMVPE